MGRATGVGVGVLRSRQETRNGSLRRTLPQKTPKLLCGRADRRWDPERWRSGTETRTAGPGEHMSEPRRFRRSVAKPGDEERKPKEDAAPEDAKTALQTSGSTLGSRTVEIRYGDEDRWPRGAHK
ncbi:hypothetical protein NDU88_005129 [Pleurodeles waltl]|uniref:Uncharacterized protein n=1 Tax=Pleurodeles waltl TaxID=8319 RepID=A0AAV7SKS1_PLEWA|nr:hypothetical protein NDU88_005129 [Pleurodeles waltl]